MNTRSRHGLLPRQTPDTTGTRRLSGRRLALLRLFNRVLVEVEFRAGRTRLLGRPYHLFVDPINICNLHCPLCPTGAGLEGRKKGKMPPAVFDTVLRELGTFARQMLLYNWGEPLLHEHIFDYVRAARAMDIETWLSTNLNRLTEESAREMVASGLSHLILSLDGTSPEGYRTYRVGGDFHRVISNAKLLHRTKQRMASPLPHVTLQFLVFRHNVHEVPRVKALASEIGADEVSILGGYLGGKGQTPFTGDPNTASLRDTWLVDDPGYRGEFDYFRTDGYLNPHPCYFLWKTATVNWDGSVSPCCCVYEPSTDFGNLLEQPFSAIWNNPLYRSARARFARGKHPAGPRNICHACRVFRPPVAWS